MDWDTVKQNIGDFAAREAYQCAVIGLGSGSTAKCFIKALAKMYHEQPRPLRCVATSPESELYARSLGLPVLAAAEWNEPVDATFDGADAVDGEGTSVKGAGGALLREKIVAFSSKKFVLLVDEQKWNRPWHEIPLPIEVLRFGIENTLRSIRSFGITAHIRTDGREVLVTPDNNCTIDVTVPLGISLEKLARSLRTIPGVIETGLFYHFASEIIIGYGNGIVEKQQVNNVSRFRPDFL